MKFATFTRLTAMLLFSCLVAGSSVAQLSNCNVFLQGNYIEVGINITGAYGTSADAPSGYHPRPNGGSSLRNTCGGCSGTGSLGFVADPDKDGWTVGTPDYYGDYFVPGLAQEGWSIKSNGVQSRAWNQNGFCSTSGSLYTGGMTGSNLSYTAIGTTRSGTWKGSNTSGIDITQVTSLDINNLYFTVKVTLKNSGSSAVPNVYYLRTVDPDNDQALSGGSFNTINTITYQLPNTLNATLVSAVAAAHPGAYLGLGTLDCRAKCFFVPGLLAPTAGPDSLYNQLWSGATYSGTHSGDDAIGLVFNLGTIAAGDSVTFSYAYILKESDLIDALNTTSSSWTTTGDTATIAHNSDDTAHICPGARTTVTIGNANGRTWSWTSLTGETISPSTGLTTTVAAGTSLIILRAIGTGGCVGTNDTLMVYISPTLPAPVTPTAGSNSPLCAGSTLNLTASTSTSGVTWLWSGPSGFTSTLQNPSIAGATTAASGVYSVTATLNTCSSGVVTTPVTVNPSPAAITPASSSICSGGTVSLSSSGGGAWSVTNTHATVNTSGLVTGMTAGVDTVRYSIGTCSVSATVTVMAAPAPISPSAASVCAGSTVTLTDATTGGTWSSGATGTATVTGGVVSGVASGVATISYSLGTCYTLATVTVNTAPDPITPSTPVTICVGTSTPLATTSTGGAWSSGNTAIGTVNSSGQVTGISAGTVAISYSIGSCSSVKIVTVISAPAAITPLSSTVCTGSSEILSSFTGGGTWTSGNTAIATIGSSSGTVNGISAGNTTITYTLGGCFVTATVTVNASPSAITPPGPVSVCVGANTTLADASPGGTWSSANTAVATVGTGGVVNGVSSGAVTISYTNAAGCFALKTITVSVTPAAISPISTTICIAGSTTLTNSVSGGTWTSGSTSVATIGSVSGTVTGVTAGSATITYSIGSCQTTSTVTVSPAASAGTITGPANVCVASTITLVDGAGGGSWSSSNTGVATVGTGTGIVTGVGAGNVTISYTVSNTCGAVVAIHTVNVVAPGVQPIAGLSSICAGTFTTYTDATTGGTWSVTNTTGTITGTGLFTGISTGIDTVRYSVTNVCGTFSTTKSVNIGPYLTAGTITGASTVCVGSAIALTDIAPGGTWSSSNTSIATVSGSIVTGVSAGVDTIMYTVTASCGSAVATHPVTVNPLPNAGAISGSAILCAGMSSPYSDPATGGIWSMTNTLATVGSASGLVTAVTPGTDTVVYTVTNSCGTARAIKPISIGAFLTAGTISGPGSVCAGSSIVLTDPAAGGAWSATNSSASVTGGTVTGLAAGVDTILYTVTSACGSVSASKTITVNPLPDAGSISGPSGVCTGSINLYTDAAPGGTWSVSNAHASITGGGTLTAISAGVDTITYTVTNTCGTASTTKVVTIGTISGAGTITGPGNVCVGSTITLADATGGGSWSSGSSSVATVGATGIVTGVSSGTATISYTVSGSCGSATATTVVTVSPVAVAGTISGPSSMCSGTFTLFTESSPGGVWSTSNGSATITGTGVVTAVTAGVDTISYTVTTGCGSATATKILTILPGAGAGPITGPGAVCIGSTITLSDATSGGVWSATNGHATVGSTGIVAGVSTGNDTVMYTVSSSCGTTVAMQVISVIATADAGTISGPSAVCVGGLVVLTDGISGGAWSASNAHATITTGGVVTGITPGTDTISYTVVSACGIASATKVITVNLLPSISPISAPASLCVGSSTLLTDATLGGTWSVSNGHATIGSSSGIITGVSTGADTVVYSVTSGCGTVATSATIMVNPLPDAGAISGPDSLCVGTSITLSDPASGGVWSAGNANATVVSGVVTGVSVGTDPITYSVTNSCGTATAIRIVSVVSFPTSGVISGSSSVCVGSGITLTDAVPGGIWVASNGNALVAGPGIIDGVTVGVDTIFYIVSNICGSSSTNKIINVYPVPVVTPITGTASECVGTTSALSDAVTGGVWSSSDPSIATVGVLTGIVSGVAVGTANITYTVTNSFGCPTSVTVVNTVNAMPVLPAITGSSNVCVGTNTTLSNPVAGGTWTSSNTSVATVGSSSGVVTGVTTGTAIITYTVVNLCGTSSVVQSIAVNAPPTVAAITGVTHQCEGAGTTLADATIGGTWVSGNTAVATVGSSSGIVTGVAAGVTTINYVFTSTLGCTVVVFAADTVVAAPVVAAISGITHECVGTTATLSDATAGGTWSSSNPSIATVSSGVVSGVAAGVTSINYSVTNGAGCTTTVSVSDTVNDVPVVAAITGVANVCVSSNITLSDATPGGLWSATNANATVTGGVVTGVVAGADTINYTVTNGCGSTTVSMGIVVNPLPDAGAISSAAAVCVGSTLTLTETVPGGVWSATNAHASVSTGGVLSGLSAGIDTVIYTVTNMCGSDFAMEVVSVNTPPTNAGSISGPSSVCKTVSITLVDTVSGGVWSASNARATVIGGIVTGVTAGLDTIRYTVSNACGSVSASKVITIAQAPSAGTITGANTVCPGSTISLTATGATSGGNWSSSNPSVAGVSGGNVTGLTPGAVTITYTVSNSCGSRSSTHGVTVLTPTQCNVQVGNVSSDPNELTVYPNPNKGTFTLNLTSVKDEQVRVVISNIIGQKVKEFYLTTNKATTVTIDNAPGFYMLSVFTSNGKYLTKVTVE